MLNKHSNALKESFEYNKDAEALYLVSDGTIYLESAKSYAKNHARSFQLQCELFTRREVIKGSSSTTTTASTTTTNGNGTEDPNAWRALPFGKLLEYANKTLGLAELKTTKTQGGKVLLAEIDALLAARPESEKTPADNTNGDGGNEDPAANTTVANHLKEE